MNNTKLVHKIVCIAPQWRTAQPVALEAMELETNDMAGKPPPSRFIVYLPPHSVETLLHTLTAAGNPYGTIEKIENAPTEILHGIPYRIYNELPMFSRARNNLSFKDWANNRKTYFNTDEYIKDNPAHTYTDEQLETFMQIDVHRDGTETQFLRNGRYAHISVRGTIEHENLETVLLHAYYDTL